MRVLDDISQTLVEFGVRNVFMLTGGGAMFLNYAIGSNPRIKTIFYHHEQACAMAAEGYTRITGQPGVINVTTGPGGINALNGVYGANTDSIPMLILSGQVKRETYLRRYDLPALRQLGDQEVDILSMVKGITKYAVTITGLQEIRYHLAKAWYLGQVGRSGPSWLDITIDVQSSQVDETALMEFTSPTAFHEPGSALCEQVTFILEKIKHAEHPVILTGTGYGWQVQWIVSTGLSVSLENLMWASDVTVVSDGEKLIELSPNMLYPVIYVFACYVPEAREPHLLDKLLRERVGNYITISHWELDGMERFLQSARAGLPTRHCVGHWATGHETASRNFARPG